MSDARRRRLSPLRRREAGFANHERLREALARIVRLADGEARVKSLVAVIDKAREEPAHWHDPAYGRQFVALATALYETGRIGFEQYVEFAGGWVVSLHEHRWMDGGYDESLAPIASRMKAIRAEHDLEAGEYWGRGCGPPEHEDLENQYDAILDGKLLEALREF